MSFERSAPHQANASKGFYQKDRLNINYNLFSITLQPKSSTPPDIIVDDNNPSFSTKISGITYYLLFPLVPLSMPPPFF